MPDTIIIFRESAWQSLLADTYTFGVLFGMLYANHRWFGDHAVVALGFLAMIMIFAVGKGQSKKRTFTEVEAAVKYLRRQ